MMDWLIIIIFILMVPTVYAFIIGAPIALSSNSRLNEIIKKSGVKRGEKFFELGSGTSRVMIGVAKNTGADIVGFELSPFLYAISWINLKLNHIKNYKLFFQNFFNANLSDADVVYVFLMPRTLEKLKDKFKRELHAGTRVVSFAFPIAEWTPYDVIKGNKKPAVYFYKVGPPVVSFTFCPLSHRGSLLDKNRSLLDLRPESRHRQ